MIAKEAINHIAKYSQAPNALVSLKQQNETFRLIISDYGKGSEEENRKYGNELRNIQRRCKQFGGVVSIKS